MADEFFSGKIYETQQSCLTKPMVSFKFLGQLRTP